MSHHPLPSAARSRVRSLLARPWLGLPALVTVVFLVHALPPYLGLDPAEARIPVPDRAPPFYYPLLVVHIFLGAIALTTACLQVWPRLRARRPAVHRWSGRLYVMAVLPAGAAVLAIAPYLAMGPNQQVGSGLLAVLWMAATVLGYRAARRRDFTRHREWMVRSFALAFAIVVNRPWLTLCLAVFAPEVLTGARPDMEMLRQAVGVSLWLSWVVNLIAAELWLDRLRARRRHAGAAAPAARAESVHATSAQPAGERA
ncbi:DUF2306 domain-containing protein [Streptomonospora alba]|uniref:DUF2306 domain-containing protein n=1 Tax=Streptomonospora alba TaxID=183763 RepID=UPI00069BCD49|nr:DUF2306 domain-containing protein [Streptomonospora alba]